MRRVQGWAAVAAALALTACGGGGDNKTTTTERSPTPGAAAPASADLVEHTGPSGFVIEAPSDWTVKASKDRLITARSQDGRAVAVYPFVAPAPVSARRCARHGAAFLRPALPGIRLTGEPSGGSAGGVDQAALGATWNGGRAALLCSVTDGGRVGMVFAIAAPADSFDADRDLLLAIARSFRATPPQGGGGEPASTATAPPPAATETFTDPAEGAFTLKYPAGWKARGGLLRRSAVEIQGVMEIVDPTGQIHLGGGDPNYRTYVLHDATLAATGFREGSEYNPGYGTTFVVRSYRTGAQIAAEMARGTYAQDCRNPQVTSARGRADLARRVGGDVNFGEVHFSCDGGAQRGYVLAGTQRTAVQGQGGVWSVAQLYGYRAAAAREAEARQALARVVASVRFSDAWARRQQKTTAAVSATVARTSQAIGDTITGGGSSYEETQATQDDVYRKWSNSTLDLTDLRDPDTGEEFKRSSGSNWYWRKNGSDEVVGNDTGDSPGIDFTLLEER